MAHDNADDKNIDKYNYCDTYNKIISAPGADETFSTPVTAQQTAGLAEGLAGPGPFTVFVPANEAGEHLPEGALDDLRCVRGFRYSKQGQSRATRTRSTWTRVLLHRRSTEFLATDTHADTKDELAVALSSGCGGRGDDAAPLRPAKILVPRRSTCSPGQMRCRRPLRTGSTDGIMSFWMRTLSSPSASRGRSAVFLRSWWLDASTTRPAYVLVWLSALRRLAYSRVEGLMRIGILLVGLSFVVGCGADSPAEKPTLDVPEHVLSLDLAMLRDVGFERLVEVYGDEIEFGMLEVLFQDGASIDGPVLDDYAAGYLWAPLPETLTPRPGWGAAYRVPLQGWGDGVVLVSFGAESDIVQVATTDSGVVNFAPGSSASDVQALETAIRQELPSFALTYFDAFGVGAFTVEPRALRRAFDQLDASPLVESTDFDKEVYVAPYEFAPYVQLSDGSSWPTVDLIPLLSITGPLRQKSWPFTTAPSLPAPFGPGRITGDLGKGFDVITAAHADVPACAAAIAERFSHVVVDEVSAAGFHVGGGASASFAIATIAMYDCVATVETRH